VLYQYRDYHRDYKMLRVLGEGFGNLEALRVLTIRLEYGRRDERDDYEDDPDVAGSLYWQAFADALGRVRHPIEVRLDEESCDNMYFTKFAVAIQGVSTIRTFRSGEDVPWEDADILMSALASLPSLENVILGCFYYERRPPAGEFPGLTNLMKSPSLRSIEVSELPFTSGLSRAMLAAFEEGSFVTDLRLSDCYLGYEGDDRAGAILALVQALQRALSLKTLSLVGDNIHAFPRWR
jgi:hypothetical protein